MCVRVCVCVCMCVTDPLIQGEREREREGVCVCVCARARAEYSSKIGSSRSVQAGIGSAESPVPDEALPGFLGICYGPAGLQVCYLSVALLRLSAL